MLIILTSNIYFKGLINFSKTFLFQLIHVLCVANICYKNEEVQIPVIILPFLEKVNFTFPDSEL